MIIGEILIKIFLFSFLALFFLGIFFSFSSTSSFAGERLNKDFYHYFSKHLIFSFLAILNNVHYFLYKNFFFKKLILPIFIISLILLILVPFIGIEIKGAKRWLDFFFSFTTNRELIKPFFVLITASLITSGKEKNSNYSYFLSLIFLSVIIILLLNQPDLANQFYYYNLGIYSVYIWN